MKDSDRAETIRKYARAASASGEKPRARSLAEALAEVPMKRVAVPKKAG